LKINSTYKVILNSLQEIIPEETPQLFLDLTEEDWRSLLNETDKQSITPLFYYRLKNSSLDIQIPENMETRLRKSYLEVSGRNLRYFYEIKNILAKLQFAKIPVILLKGAHLAEKIYGNTTLREFCDVDILIKKNDLALACKQFEELGYSASRDFLIDGVSELVKHLPPFEKTKAPAVEIHWTLTNHFDQFNINLEDLWQRAEKNSVLDTPALGLCPEDLLLHLSMHGLYQHYFEYGLRTLYDLSVVIRHYEEMIDWKVLISRAREWKMERCLFLALFMTQMLLKTELPEEVGQNISALQLNKSFVENVVKSILKKLPMPQQGISQHLISLEGAKSGFKKFRILFSRFFPSKKEMAN